MIKKNNCFIYPGNKTIKTTNRNNAKKPIKKPCILYQAEPKQPPKQEKTL